MKTVILSIESIVASLPLPLLEVWGRLAFIIGLGLALAAYGGFTFRPAGRWGFGRERQAWDGKALLSIPLTFLAILTTGYLGSFIVLVPGAQTLESLKDLMVFLCIVLFGYPALLTVPFAYGLSDLIEGVPPEFLLDWLPGYFINPACFWLAYQLFGKDPDFRKPRTWGPYLGFVACFLALEPMMWGYLCSGQFSSGISYRSITSALFFTTSLTWVLAAPAMLLAFPLAKKFGMFWAEIPGHVREKAFGSRDWTWVSGGRRGTGAQGTGEGWPIRLVLAAPFLLLMLLMVGATAFVTLRSAQQDAEKLASQLQEESSRTLGLQLEDLLRHSHSKAEGAVPDLLKAQPIARNGLVLVLDQKLMPLGSSREKDDPVAAQAVLELTKVPTAPPSPGSGIQYRFDYVTEKPLSRTTWMVHASHHQGPRKEDWTILTVIPEAYYLAGIQTGNSRSAMVFAVALLLALGAAAFLAAWLTSGLKDLSQGALTLARGDLSRRVKGGALAELRELSWSFNHMAEQLSRSFAQLQEEAKRRRAREADLEKSEGRLRVSEERLQLAVRSAKLGIWDWDVKNDRLVWDDSMYRLYGVDKSSFKGAFQAWSECLDPRDLQRANEEVQAALKGEKPFDTQFRVRSKNGSLRIIRGLAEIIRSPAGKPLRMVGVNWDMTERLEAEEDLKEEQTFMRLAQEAAQVGSWEWEVATGRFQWSDELCRIHGITPGEFDGELSTVMGFCHPYDRERFQGVLGNVLSVKEDTGFECRIVRKDGKERHLWFLGKTQVDEQGDPVKVLGIALDITDRKDLEFQFQQAQKMEAVGHLAGGIAHDFNNMLTAILGFAKFLKAGLDPQDPKSADVDQIIATSERAASLTRQLLTFSRKQVIQPVPLDLNRSVRETEKMLKPLLGFDIKLELDLSPSPVLCLVDPGQFHQAILNLAVNSHDAMPQGGLLLIKTQVLDLGTEDLKARPQAKPGRFGLVQVTDTGSGMTPETLAKIYEPFFTTKGVGKGTGLGLPVVYGVVQQNGGFIEAVSKPGAGTTFKLFFPYIEDKGGVQALNAVEADVPGGRESVLVVDDEGSLRQLAKRALETYGYRVRTAADGLEALKILHDEPGAYSLLVTDVVMPRMTGPVLAEAVKEILPDLPILFVSGHADDITARYGLPLKGADLLPKPYSPQDLARRVRRALDDHQTHGGKKRG